MCQLKNSSFCLGKTHWKLRYGCCCNYLLRGRSVIFFLSLLVCNKILDYFCCLFQWFTQRTSKPGLFDRPFQMCSCVFSCFITRVCFSLLPLFYFKTFFLFWKNIWQLGCFSEWLPLLLLFRLRVLLGKNCVLA